MVPRAALVLCCVSCTSAPPARPVAPAAEISGPVALDRRALGDVAFTCSGTPLHADLPAPAPAVEIEVRHPGALADASTIVTFAGAEPRVFRAPYRLFWVGLRLGFRLQLETDLVDAEGDDYAVIWLRPTVDGAERHLDPGPVPPAHAIDPSGGIFSLRHDMFTYALDCTVPPR